MGTLEIVLIVLLALLAAAITVVVILQQGRGADIGAAFGAGGANTIFGSTGLASPLATLTWSLAGVFLVLCMTLAYLAKNRADEGLPANGDIPMVPVSAPMTDVPVVPSAPGPSGAPPVPTVSAPATGPAPAAQGVPGAAAAGSPASPAAGAAAGPAAGAGANDDVPVAPAN
jgi:preprotein translocase subunit SecG